MNEDEITEHTEFAEIEIGWDDSSGEVTYITIPASVNRKGALFKADIFMDLRNHFEEIRIDALQEFEAEVKRWQENKDKYK